MTSARITCANSRVALADMIRRGERVHSIVTDPPYGLTSVVKRFGKEGSAPALSNGPTGVYRRASAGFMGKVWDGTGIERDPEFWRLCWDVLPPGGHLLAFGGTRTWHRIACAIEDAGFEIRDSLLWLYGTGFPKSHDVAKGVEARTLLGASGPKALRQLAMGEEYRPHPRAGEAGFRDGNSRSGMDGDRGVGQTAELTTAEALSWEGWGTALKPAWEPVIVARKPLVGTVAENVLTWGTGALNIGACRIETTDNLNGGAYAVNGSERDDGTEDRRFKRTRGRSTLNGDDREGAAAGMFQEGKTVGRDYEQPDGRWPANVLHDGSDDVEEAFAQFGPKVSRFFYCAKASRADRGPYNRHPTVKPHELMRWLVRLVTPPGGTVLDPFMGSGSTGKAAIREGFSFVGMDDDPESAWVARQRVGAVDPLTEVTSDVDTLLAEAEWAVKRATRALAP